MRGWLICVSLFCTLGLLAIAQAQPPAAINPSYQVRLRYKIDAELQQRYALYKQMLARLQAAGFQPAPGRPREELYGDSLSGVMPATGLGALRLERFLRTAILVPTGYQLPTDAEKTVLVRLELALTGPDRQKELFERAKEQLKTMGFIENEAHDHANHTRLLGRLSVPALDGLLKDTMETPIPSSFKSASMVQQKQPLVRLAIVIAETAPPQADVARATPAPAGKEYLDKISPDLKAFLAKVPEGDLDKLMRVELVLVGNQLTDRFRSQLIHSETRFVTEGSIGNIVTGLTTPSRLTALAQQSEISTVRLPQLPRTPAIPSINAIEFIPLGKNLGTSPYVSTLVSLEPKPATRAVIIGDDFRGYQKLLGEGLPKNTKLIDATAELSLDFKPAPEAEGQDIGQSAKIARGFLKQFPHDEVILVRIDPSTPYQLNQVGEAILGRPWLTPSLIARRDEFKDETSRIESEKLEMRVIRQRIQRDFNLDDVTKAKRDDYRDRQAKLDAREKAHYEQGLRFEAFIHEVASLKGANTACISLQWTDGYTDIPGYAPQLRQLSRDILRGANWYQAVVLRPGQVFTGLYRDVDNDGDMEFSHRSSGRKDLAFLAWDSSKGGAKEPLLPDNTVVQVTLNWFEVHASGDVTDDKYRKPLADFTLNVLKQRDPTGKQLPADAFEVVARTPALPDRVEHNNRGSYYQTIVRFTVPAGGGRYALQLTGTPPAGTGEVGEKAEIHPKITLEVVDPAKRAAGRVVFESVATPE
jgi:hypothetical protein